jgi:hypothetical protein
MSDILARIARSRLPVFDCTDGSLRCECPMCHKVCCFIRGDYYQCNDCSAHGDAISLVMIVDGLSFVDAVERISEELDLPFMTPPPFSMPRVEQLKRILTSHTGDGPITLGLYPEEFELLLTSVSPERAEELRALAADKS